MAPLIHGGQGRSDREMRDSANAIAIYALLAVVALLIAVLWGRP